LVLSSVVTALLISLRNDRQRRDLALLRMRGATPRRAATLLGLTALFDGVLGAGVGVGGAFLATKLALGSQARPSTAWLIAGALTGLLLAVVTELTPIARLLRGRSPSVQQGATQPTLAGTPLPLRLGLDVL